MTPSSIPDATELERLGLYDPSGPDADDRLAFVRYLLERGVPHDEIADAHTLRELADLAWSYVFGPTGERMPFDEVAARAGMPEETARCVWRAAGFPDPRTPGRRFTSQDVETMHVFAEGAQLLGEEHMLQFARVIGASLERIAEAGAALMRVNFEAPLRSQGASHVDFVRTSGALTEALLPGLARVMDTIFRRKLLDVSSQRWSLDVDQTATTLELAVGFADIVGFSQQVGACTTRDLARIVDEFEGRVSDAVTRTGGRVVKHIGDEVMFVADGPDTGCACALDLIRLAEVGTIPDVRVGIAFGQVMTRYGDYYGPVVNIAARLVGIAEPGSSLVTSALAERAGNAFVFVRMPSTKLKGIAEPIAHYCLSQRR